jgi:hypothetical protein
MTRRSKSRAKIGRDFQAEMEHSGRGPDQMIGQAHRQVSEPVSKAPAGMK